MVHSDQVLVPECSWQYVSIISKDIGVLKPLEKIHLIHLIHKKCSYTQNFKTLAKKQHFKLDLELPPDRNYKVFSVFGSGSGLGSDS